MLIAGMAIALLLAGCGGGATGGNDKPTTSSGSDKDKELAYAQCMRQHGYDMKDPSADGDGVSGIRPDDPKFGPANEACAKLLPNGGQPKPEDPAQVDKQRKYATCMRQHGIDIPDPQPGQAMPLPNGDDPKFPPAFAACKSLLG